MIVIKKDVIIDSKNEKHNYICTINEIMNNFYNSNSNSEL